MGYNAKNYEGLLGLTGFSDVLLNNHFGLYNGYVANTNTIYKKIKEHATGTLEYGELSRRFGWEFNGMRLHELYFDALTKNPQALADDSTLMQTLVAEFGSIDVWREDFLAKGAMRGIGWVILAYDRKAKRLFNVWINEHDMGHLVGAVPLVVMDVFEHAFILDYGTDRATYLTAYMDALDWTVIAERLE